MNSKMTTNSQLSTIEWKKNKQTKQTTGTGTESQKSHGGYQWGGGRKRMEGKDIRNKKHKW